MDNIMNTATDNIPKTTYKLKPAFSESTKTKKLNIIYHQRHLLYRNHMTPDKSRTLLTIKQHIDDSIYNDFSKFWTNELDKIQPMRANDPKNFFKNIRHLRGTGPHNNGTHLKINNDIITDPQQQSEIAYSPILGKTILQTNTTDMQSTTIMRSDTGYTTTWTSLTHTKIQTLTETQPLQNPYITLQSNFKSYL